MRGRKARSEARPGDLIFISSGGRVSHVGIYIGNGQVIEAPRPGKNVQIVGLDAFSGGWGVQMPF